MMDLSEYSRKKFSDGEGNFITEICGAKFVGGELGNGNEPSDYLNVNLNLQIL
jgi:hypothetical protein